ncbi:DUF397 domain-containing protein [Pseudonocardia spinosispora]|uniref:DUF397 domain-containing protein n=1 Tax=Pseudonocardia spinosispora TaxID=103441 RepID=UPI000404F333|nr:DUF397 domain-containing protein [Pseudonocardia spinosispora]
MSQFQTASWRKAQASEPQQSCVEFALVGDVIGVRDSKVTDGPILQFNRTEIAAMLDGVRNGEFDDLG